MYVDTVGKIYYNQVNLLNNLDLNPLENPDDNYNELDKIIQTVKNKHFLQKKIEYQPEILVSMTKSNNINLTIS